MQLEASSEKDPQQKSTTETRREMSNMYVFIYVCSFRTHFVLIDNPRISCPLPFLDLNSIIAFDIFGTTSNFMSAFTLAKAGIASSIGHLGKQNATYNSRVWCP